MTSVIHLIYPAKTSIVELLFAPKTSTVDLLFTARTSIIPDIIDDGSFYLSTSDDGSPIVTADDGSFINVNPL